MKRLKKRIKVRMTGRRVKRGTKEKTRKRRLLVPNCSHSKSSRWNTLESSML